MKHFPYGKSNQNIFHSLNPEEVSFFKDNVKLLKTIEMNGVTGTDNFFKIQKILNNYLDYNSMNFRPRT